MDALSLIFDDIHLAKSEYLYLNLYDDTAFNYIHEPSMLAYVVLEGQAFLSFDDATQSHLKQGDLVLLTSGTAHQIRHSERVPLNAAMTINTHFDRDRHTRLNSKASEQNSQQASLILAIRAKLDLQMAKPLINALPQLMRIQHITGDHTPEWMQIGLQFLAYETRQMLPGHDKILDHLVSILLIETVRDYILNLDDSQNWLHALTHPQLANALSAIHAQPEQAWTVESLAELCCMSRSKFAQVFSQIVGQSPLAYLQQHRLRLAAQSLRDSQDTIQRIAHRVGYSSETAFSQSFKKYFEQTPSQYRQQSQGKS